MDIKAEALRLAERRKKLGCSRFAVVLKGQGLFTEHTLKNYETVEHALKVKPFMAEAYLGAIHRAIDAVEADRAAKKGTKQE